MMADFSVIEMRNRLISISRKFFTAMPPKERSKKVLLLISINNPFFVSFVTKEKKESAIPLFS